MSGLPLVPWPDNAEALSMAHTLHNVRFLMRLRGPRAGLRYLVRCIYFHALKIQ